MPVAQYAGIDIWQVGLNPNSTHKGTWLPTILSYLLSPYLSLTESAVKASRK
jgi:hypothetical protein